jgi:hypothetical protein
MVVRADLQHDDVRLQPVEQAVADPIKRLPRAVAADAKVDRFAACELPGPDFLGGVAPLA